MKEGLDLDINFISDFCPTIEILALESEHVFWQSGDLLRVVSFGTYRLSAKLLKNSIFCSFVNKRQWKQLV